MQQSVKPQRAVGALGAALMPVNGMVGAGIFAAPAVLYASAGDFAPWMFALMALVFLPIAWCYAKLSSRFDGSGGPQLYAQTAFGPFLGFQAGWMSFASAASSGAANTYVLVAYLAALFPGLADATVQTVLVCAILLLFGWLNYIGIGRAIAALGTFSIGKFLPILGLALIGLVMFPPEVRLALPSFSTVESVALITFYTFMGFEGLATTAGEVKNPRRTIPAALLVSLGIITLLYMLVQWAYIGSAPAGAGDGGMPLATMAAALVGSWGAAVIADAAVLSIAANTLHGLIYAPRLAFGMAENGLLPRIFAHVSERYRTPDMSIAVNIGASILFALTGAFVFLAVASTLTRIATYVLSSLSLPVIRHREVAGGEWRWSAGYLLMPAISVAACLWVAIQAEARAFLIFGGIFAVGALLYWFARYEVKQAGREGA